MSNILSIAQTALAAAQTGLATTGHNIANAQTPGYSRQVVLQASAGGQNEGAGFVGKGTTVVGVRRVYSEYLSDQVKTAQTSEGQLGAHYTEISRINNLLADPESGLSPVLQDFFKTAQDLAANKGAGPSRHAMLASAESLAGRLQSMDGQLREIRDGVNEQITATVSTINSYSQQIANLNDAISKAQNAAGGHPPNDLLDQRDHLVSELSKQTRVTTVKEGSSYSVFIGNGQPMVIGPMASTIEAVPSASNLSEVQIGLTTSNGIVRLADGAIQGGKLGGLLEFRTQSLDAAQNQLGRIAIGMAATFNAQHKLGMDQNGVMGGDFFKEASPAVYQNSLNTGDAEFDASIADVGALKANDYRVSYDGAKFNITRIDDNATLYSQTTLPPTTIDGVTFSVKSGTMAAGDSFMIRPTANGAADFDVLVTDKSKIAAATPINTQFALSNSGSGRISAGTVQQGFTTATVTPAVTLSYDAATNTLTGFPDGMDVSVNGVPTTGVAGASAKVTYVPGATITFGGASVEITGAPADKDTFSVSRNQNADGDGRNILLLGNLQAAKTLEGGTTSYQGAFGELVSLVGNKTHELEVTKTAEGKLLSSIVQAQQSESGVNLDEEATNLLRYQQAYQAAGKLMQTVNEMFNILVSLGR